MSSTSILRAIFFLTITPSLFAQDNQRSLNQKMVMMRTHHDIFSRYCNGKYLIKETIRIAKKMDVDLDGWHITIADNDDEGLCNVHLKSKKFTMGQAHLNNKSLIGGLIPHEIGHIKHKSNGWQSLIPHTIGFASGFILGKKIAKKYVKTQFLKIVAECSGAVFAGNIANNLYHKYHEHLADTESIQFLKSEKDYKGLIAMEKLFFHNKHSIEETLGDYPTEIIDTVLSALTFEKISILGKHPTNTSRAKRFRKAAQEVKKLL